MKFLKYAIYFLNNYFTLNAQKIITLSESCPPSKQNPCGYKCASLCHAWRAATYECIHGNDGTCCFTCGQEVSMCPGGQVLRDENTCIAPKDCPCILKNGNILAVSFRSFISKSV